MKATLALLVAVASSAKANPGGGGGWGGQGGGDWGDHTEYQTHVVTSAVVSQWHEVKPSICETWSVSKAPPVTTTITTKSVWTEPGQTIERTKYVPCPTTLPGKDITVSIAYTTVTTVTHETTIYKPYTTTETLIITSNNTITLATTIPTTQTVPTTIPTTQLISTTDYIPTTIEKTQLLPTTYVYYSEVTKQGSTQTLAFTETSEVTVLQTVPTTIISENTQLISTTITAEGPTQVQYSTVSLSGSTIVVENTVTAPGLTQVQYSTVSLSGTTLVVENTITAQGPTQTLISTLPGETIIGPTVSTTLLEYSTISLNGTTQIITLPQSTVIDVEYSTLPGETIIQSLPGETVIYTASAPTIISYVTITQPAVTITEAPPPPASTCNATGFFPGPDGNACGGESCYLDLDLGAAVHWDTVDHYPRLLTVAQFENPSAKATCITTICNTAAFEKYYATSIQSCARPPCPSNSLDCDCNIVVGPLVLPGGQTTSVTQTGTEGWYLNLGPTATAVNVPSCSSGSPQCLTSIPTTRPEPLLYTGRVIPETAANMSNATPTQFLLPDLPGYFPPDSPFGDCTTAVFDPVATTSAPRLRREHLHRRQQQRFADAGSFTWPATDGLTDSTTYTAQLLNAPSAPTSPLGPTQPVPGPSSTPENSPPPAASTPTVTPPTVTVTQSPPPEQTPTGEPSSPAETSPSSAQPSPPGSTESTPPPASGPTSTPPNNTPESTTLPPVVSATSLSAAPNTESNTGINPTGSEPSSASAGSTSASEGGSIGSSTATATSVTTGPDGIATVTETVFYSMISSPGSESLSNATSATSSGPATQTSGVGSKQKPRWLVVSLTLLAALTLLL